MRARRHGVWQAVGDWHTAVWNPKVPGHRVEGCWHNTQRVGRCRRLGAWQAGCCGCLGVWWAGCSRRLGVQSPVLAFAPAKAGCMRLWVCLRAKNDVRLRFNSESGSSRKSRRPSTCRFANASCPDTEPARFKTQTCRFFLGRPGPQVYKPRLEAKKSARCEGFSIRVGRLRLGEVTPGAKRAPIAPGARSQWTESQRRVEGSPMASGAGRCGRAL